MFREKLQPSGKRFIMKNCQIHRLSSDNSKLSHASRTQTVSRREHSQSVPCPAFSFFLQLFKCFSPSYLHVPCSSVLPSRVKIRIFTLIELLIVIAIITIRLNSFFWFYLLILSIFGKISLGLSWKYLNNIKGARTMRLSQPSHKEVKNWKVTAHDVTYIFLEEKIRRHHETVKAGYAQLFHYAGGGISGTGCRGIRCRVIHLDRVWLSGGTQSL